MPEVVCLLLQTGLAYFATSVMGAVTAVLALAAIAVALCSGRVRAAVND